MVREWIQAELAFQSDREERESQDKSKTVEQGDWVGAASRAPPHTPSGDLGGMVREWIQAELAFQSDREEREREQ